jgi:hypothetical protein
MSWIVSSKRAITSQVEGSLSKQPHGNVLKLVVVISYYYIPIFYGGLHK